MNNSTQIRKIFEFIGEDFIKELNQYAVFVNVKSKTEIVKEGQDVKYVPFLISGLLKVFTINEDKELLYYYIVPNESCIMTFSSIFNNSVSKVYSITEKNSEILLLPTSKVKEWIIKYPKINSLFYKQYEHHYTTMMEMVNQAIFYKLDKRILEYIHQKSKILDSKNIKISHKEIANSLGTAREVVSRILKKFEAEGLIIQKHQEIEIIHQM